MTASPPRRMEAQPLLMFKSHIDGKNADVSVYSDRIDWHRKGGVSAGKITAGVATFGVSLAKTGVAKAKAGSEMIPVRNIASVTSERDGVRFTKITVVASGNNIDFRVAHGEAQNIMSTLHGLLLGDAPAATTPSAAPPPAPAAPPPPPDPSLPPPPPQPGTSEVAAGWYDDPGGSGRKRYWDGAAWTEHFAD